MTKLELTANTGYPVLYRTYSRRKETGERESLYEIFERSLGGLVKLANYTPEQLELVRQEVYKLHTFMSGRWLWIGGTAWVEDPRNVDASYNCTSLYVDSWDDFKYNFDLLMKGCGVGTVVEMASCLLPSIKHSVSIEIDTMPGDYPYSMSPSKTTIAYHTKNKNQLIITVADTREGWVEGYTALMYLASNTPIKSNDHVSILFDGKEVDSFVYPDEHLHIYVELGFVRPAGVPIKGFGGVSDESGLCIGAAYGPLLLIYSVSGCTFAKRWQCKE